MLLLHGKIRNAVDIEQAQPETPRQDVKHVAMLSLCVPHFLEDVRVQVSDAAKQKEALENYITALTALKNNYSGRQFEAQNPGTIRRAELIPQTVQRMSFSANVQSLLRQFASQGQSRDHPH